MNENEKLFKVYPRTEADKVKAQILEDIINAPKFREAVLKEFEAQAKTLAEKLLNESVLWRVKP